MAPLGCPGDQEGPGWRPLCARLMRVRESQVRPHLPNRLAAELEGPGLWRQRVKWRWDGTSSEQSRYLHRSRRLMQPGRLFRCLRESRASRSGVVVGKSAASEGSWLLGLLTVKHNGLDSPAGAAATEGESFPMGTVGQEGIAPRGIQNIPRGWRGGGA